MTATWRLHRKMMLKLQELPEHRRYEKIPELGMTWHELAKKIMSKKKHRDVKELLRRAEEAHII